MSVPGLLGSWAFVPVPVPGTEHRACLPLFCSGRIWSGLVWSGLIWMDLGSGSVLLLHYCSSYCTACTSCACFGASWEDPGSTICNQD